MEINPGNLPFSIVVGPLFDRSISDNNLYIFVSNLNYL